MRKGKSMVITSGKGGVGKTTTTANLGIGYAQLGHKVCMVDADIGLRNLDIVLGLENRIVYDLVDVVEGRVKLEKALTRDKRFKDNLFILPTAQNRDKDAVSPAQMKELLDELKTMFDYTIVDCPAGIEQGFKNAISGADMAIIVTMPEVAAVRDADRIAGLLEAAGLNPQKDIFLVINRVRAEMIRKGDMLDLQDMNDILNLTLVGLIPDDERIIVSTNRGEPVLLDPKSRSGQAYRNIVQRLEGVDIPFTELDEGGLLGRLKSLFSAGGKR